MFYYQKVASPELIRGLMVKSQQSCGDFTLTPGKKVEN
jgi:hypothetical protein